MATALLGWTASVFTRIEVIGGPIPDGPVLVVANHLIALLDSLIIFRVAGRPTSPLAKAPLFDQRVVGGILRSLGGLPVYRRQDDPSQMDRNEDTFRGAIDALHRGVAILIFPEGKSHSEPSLVALRTGAARIALRAEAERDGRLGLQIVPVGLTYDGKHLFRTRVLAEIGEPFSVSAWMEKYAEDEKETVRALTDAIAVGLHGVTLNLEQSGDRDLLVAAARIYTREKGLHGWRERETMAEEVPRLRRLAGHLAWLRVQDPDRYKRLSASVRHHERIARFVGAREGVVPPTYRAMEVARYVIREGGALVLGLPLAALGSALWYPTWLVPQWIVPRIGPAPESIATYKLATGMVLVPITLAALTAVGWLVWGWLGALAAGIGAPILGLIAISWRERWARVRDDIALFFAVIRRPRFRARLAETRRKLVTEFDAILVERNISEIS